MYFGMVGWEWRTLIHYIGDEKVPGSIHGIAGIFDFVLLVRVCMASLILLRDYIRFLAKAFVHGENGIGDELVPHDGEREDIL
jgi:hypothetical protein